MVRYRLAAGVFALLAVASCGTTTEKVIGSAELERGVSASLEQAGRPHERISCPDQVKAQAAESTECTMTANGMRYRITVIVKSVEGEQASYDVDVHPQPLP